MAEAFGWGALGASALLVGALIAYLLAPGRRVIAVVMALGTGLLIGSVSFELVDEALEHQAVAWVALLVLVGAAVFTVGDWLLERRGGGDRKDATGAQADGVAAGDRARLGARRHPRVVRARPHRPPGRGERVPAGRGRAVEPARGHVVLQRPQGGRLAAAAGCC